MREDTDFFKRYEAAVTLSICRILRAMFLVFPALFAATAAGIFHIEMSYFYAVIPLGYAVCFLPALLLKLNVCEKAVKGVCVLAVGVIICILAANRDVGIYITYMLMTVLATMYFDRAFAIPVALLGYVFMAIGLYLRAPGMLELESGGKWGHSVAQWYVSHLAGYTIEYTVMAALLISIAGRAKQLLVDLKETGETALRERAEKERIGAELNVATQIQASMLPCIFPAFPERGEFDIHASMRPAKEVGGDFYDFFLIDENTLAVVIADVSGKGIPAALFMVIAKTLIQNTALSGKRPEVVFGIVNRMLCENNEAGMFVTAFLGYLDLCGGGFTFVNAGHNPPLIKRAGKAFEFLKARPGFVLAGDESTYYIQQEIELNPGDELFLYTDGVTESANPQNELFGDSRLVNTVNIAGRLALPEFMEQVGLEIDAFAGGAGQADDITMLALRYHG